MENGEKSLELLKEMNSAIATYTITILAVLGALGILNQYATSKKFDALEKKVNSLTQSQLTHTEKFCAERQELKYVEIMVDGIPVKAYFEVDGQSVEDYLSPERR